MGLKRILYVGLIFVTACVSAACANQNANVLLSAEPQTTEKIAEHTRATEIADGKEMMELTLVENQKTDYVIVYDGSADVTQTAVKNMVKKIYNDYGVKFNCKDVGTTNNTYEHEIVIGGVREQALRLKDKLMGENDFAIEINQDGVLLLATNEVSTRYMLDYFFNEMISKIKNGKLTLTADNSIVQSNSELSRKSYIEYLREKGGGKCTPEMIYQVFETRKYESTSGDRLNYRLYVPFDYSSEKEYPVLLLMHGAGQRGVDNQDQLRYMLHNLMDLENSPVEQSIVIAPQCPSGEKWVDMIWENGNYSVENTPESNELKCVMEILESVANEFSVDRNRFYVTGLSMGGIAAWDLLMRHSDVFAGGVPICGAADPAMASVLKDVPIWTVHGEEDVTVPTSATREVVAAIKAAGGAKIKYTELKGEGHTMRVWNDYVSTNSDIYNWLYAQSLASR